MLSRYLLSTLTKKVGYLFEDFEDSDVEFNAWTGGVVVLRNLHLRKDVLKYLGVPSVAAGDEDEEDDGRVTTDDWDDDDDSDDDSFRSCASDILDDEDGEYCDGSRVRREANPSLNNNDEEDRRPPLRPTIEVTYGYIGSLELHMPWKLLRSNTSKNDGSDNGISSDTKDDSLLCSVTLSDVRILLSPSNHTRNQSRSGRSSTANNYRQPKGDANKSSSMDQKLLEEERTQRQRELAVQSLIEREILKRIKGGGESDNNAVSNEFKDGWLARWAKGLITRIVSSLQVKIQNIHIRYEDEGHGWFDDRDSSRSAQTRHQYRPSFAVGMRLDSFSIRNTNSEEEVFTSNAKSQHKVAKVEKLSVYWDSSNSDLFVGYASAEKDRDYYDKRFSELDIMYDDEFDVGGTPQHTYLIQPVSPSLHLMMCDQDVSAKITPAQGECSANERGSSSLNTASIHAKLCLPSCHIGFDHFALKDLAYVRKCLSAYKVQIISAKERVTEQRISQLLLDLKPPSGISPVDNPRVWWKYAISAVREFSSDRSYFEGRSNVKKQRWRSGWLGLARLLRLRNEYTALYRSLWSSSSRNEIETEARRKIHHELLTLEDTLSHEEIAAFRMSAVSTVAFTELKSIDLVDYEPVALDSLSALSLEYREFQLHQIAQSINSDLFNIIDDRQHISEESKRALLVLSARCQEFFIQVNNASSHITNMPQTLAQRQQVVPIARLQSHSSLTYEKFSNGSWNLSCALNSLTVSDLISPGSSGVEGKTLVGRKSSLYDQTDDYTASITVRNVITNDKGLQYLPSSQATTYIDVKVSPLEVTYSTIAFEALTRTFAAMKTDEFNRDYSRITQALSRWKSRQSERIMSVLARRKKFVVSVDIAAPVFQVPEDLQNINAPTLIIDLGQLTFRSDSSEVPLPTGFDDRWLLRADSIRALYIQQLSDGKLSEHAIIEPFSLEVNIMTHIAAADDGGSSTKMSIQAMLPRLSFGFTSSAIRLLTRLQLSWNALRPPQTRRQTIDDFLLQAKDVQNSYIGVFSGSPRLPEGQTFNTSLKAVQEIKFSFEAPSIYLEIVNDIPSLSTSMPLIHFSVRGISGEHTLHSGEAGASTQFVARLQSIHAMDCCRTIGGNLLSSVDPELLEDGDSIHSDVSSDEDLVHVEMTTQQNGDKEMSIHLQNLYVEWNPELFARIQMDFKLPLEEREVNAGVSLDKLEFFDALDVVVTADNDEDIADLNQAPDPSPQFNITFHLSKLRVNFNKDSQHRCFFTAEMNQTDISHYKKPLTGGSFTSATVADARLMDPDALTGKTLYGQMIGLQSSSQPSSIVQMSFETFTSASTTEPEFHNSMKIDFSAMKFIYIHQFWMELVDYFYEGILGSAVWGSAPKPVIHIFNPLHAKQPFKRTQMHINMEHPVLLLPTHSRSPHHIRLEMNALTVTSHFVLEKVNINEITDTNTWLQWFHKAKLNMLGIDILSWDGHKLNNAVGEEGPPSLAFDIRWPVGPTTPLIKPKWNIDGKVDPIIFKLSQKDFSLFRFFVSYNLCEESRFLAKSSVLLEESLTKTLILFGYEKTNTPPTTYSISLLSKLLEFQFILDEEESKSRKVEGIMTVRCSKVSWSMLKNADCITKTHVNIESIKLTQTSKNCELGGFPDLLLPLPAASSNVSGNDESNTSHPHCLLQFTSTTQPDGNHNAKTLHLDSAGIFYIVPAWQHCGKFFQNLPTTPEVFALEDMHSIMQIGDRFYRMTSSKTNKEDEGQQELKMNNTRSGSSHFLLHLAFPRIILVADAATKDNCQSIMISMCNLHFLREINMQNENFVAFCDGLEVSTGKARSHSSSSGSSLLYPLSISSSLTKSSLGNGSDHISGWVWTGEVQVRAAYTDLTHTIYVINGIETQLRENEADIARSISARHSTEYTKQSQNSINIEALCDGVHLIVIDDSHRHFANNQPFVDVSMIGLRVFYAVSVLEESKDLRLLKNTFISLDSFDLTDLLRQKDCPFRKMATSTTTEKHGLFSFLSPIELDPMLWKSHCINPSKVWGFEMSKSFRKRDHAIHQLIPPDSYFDVSSVCYDYFFAFNSALHDTGCHSVDISIRKLTTQYNPSLIVAGQRFLGRLKKEAHSILHKATRNSSSDTIGAVKQSLPNQFTTPCNVIFSVNAKLESLDICLNKEHQQRHLLDVLVSGVNIHLKQYRDQSLILDASVDKLRAWDPDTSKIISDRNRKILASMDSDDSGSPFFSFQYRTFRTPKDSRDELPLPDWIKNKATSGDIDDYLTAKICSLEFNFIRERTAELLDYLTNGLPGKGMGATSKAAQSFCSSRIRSHSFLDVAIDKPRVFIPQCASSTVGGLLLIFDTMTLTSWFEEACVHNKDICLPSLVQGSTFSFSSKDDESNELLDWWRVLNLKVGIGIHIEIDKPISELVNNPGTFFSSNITMHKPSLGEITVIQCSTPSLNINLKYREFIMIDMVVCNNIGIDIDESKWDNIEKSYWQEQEDILYQGNASIDDDGSSTVYAETARLVHFGKVKTKSGESKSFEIGFCVDTISVVLHRDDWFDNLDSENAALLCYDICDFSIHSIRLGIVMKSNGDRVVSIALHDMSFTDLGDYGRLARDIYLDSRDCDRPPSAFSVVAEGYDMSSTDEDPLVSFIYRLHYDTSGIEAHHTRERVTRNMELKVKSLSVTVLPRSIDDVNCFLSKKWICPNSTLDTQIVKPSLDTTDKCAEVTSNNSAATTTFKFVAMYPRLILLADETNPFSRGLVLRGLAVGNMCTVGENASSVSSDKRSTTTLSGHIKEYAINVVDNIDNIIRPNPEKNADIVPLIDPVTAIVELRIVSRNRFPTERYCSIEISEPVALILSFSDLALIETVIRKYLRKKDKQSHDKYINCGVQLPGLDDDCTHSNSLHSSKSSDVFNIDVFTEKIGITLRKCGPDIIVESSQNASIVAGDILISVNGQSIESLHMVVNMFENMSRPLTITLSRLNPKHEPASQHQQYMSTDSINTITSNSSLFEMSLNLVEDGDGNNTGNKDSDRTIPQLVHFDLVCQYGRYTGIDLVIGIGNVHVVNNVDFEVLSQCTQTNSNTSLIRPGAVLLAIDGNEIDRKDSSFVEVCQRISSYEISELHQSYTMSFVEADTSIWGTVSHFDSKLSINLTVIDDTNGRDMPIFRIGLNKMALKANHGLIIPTKSLNVRWPTVLSLSSTNQIQVNENSSPVSSFTTQIESLTMDYNNAVINQWEPIIEPHYLVGRVEHQSGNGSHPGQSTIIICDQYEGNHTPLDFICVNVSDSAVHLLSKSAKRWRERKNAKPQPVGEAGISTNTALPHSPICCSSKAGSQTASSSTDLKKATKLAKMALIFSRKHGKVHKENKSPFLFRNSTGVTLSFTVCGAIETFIVGEGQETKFHMNASIKKYDGRFPVIDIQLDLSERDLFSDPITGLSTDRVGSSMRGVYVWKRKEVVTQVSQKMSLIWTVELSEGRRVMTLHSATSICAFGCGLEFDIGFRLARDDDFTNETVITKIGIATRSKTFHLPLWLEACFCQVDIFLRPSTRRVDNEDHIYNWSNFPMLSLKENYWNADATEVVYNWTAQEGVSCSLNPNIDPHRYDPIWLQFTKDNDKDALIMTIWSAITVRNMLPCTVEWEVASNAADCASSIFDSSSKRAEQQHACTSLQCGGATEIYTSDALDQEVYIRFKCIVCDGCSWSEWLCIELDDGTLKKTLGTDPVIKSKQLNIQCKNDTWNGSNLTIGVRISSHAGKGVNLIMYAEIWMRNLTALPLTFGAPSIQLSNENYTETTLSGKISADSALIELSSMFESNSFGLFTNDDEDDEDTDLDDILNLPLQQCQEQYEEVFEYVLVSTEENVERRWWASDNHISPRQQPEGNDWKIDCAGDLHSGWESCSNIAGDKSSFNGRRSFNNRHRFRRRRWFRRVVKNVSFGDHSIFHQPEDLDHLTRSKREAGRNTIGIDLDDRKGDGSNILDMFNRPQQDGFLDIMTRVANDGSILIHVKLGDGKWSTPAIIPPSGSGSGVIRVCSSRWPKVTREKQTSAYSPKGMLPAQGKNVGIAPLDSTVFELVYLVTVLSGLWGELSRMVNMMPRFLIRNESSWLDIEAKQVGSPDTSAVLIKKGDVIPFYWYDVTLPELVCVRPAQSRNSYQWSGGFDLCSLGMLPIRVRRVDGSVHSLKLKSMRVNVELQPGTGGSGTLSSILEEDPKGEGSLFRIENYSPFRIFYAQDGLLANRLQYNTSVSCDVIEPSEHTSYALDVPWRQGKYAGRSSATQSELLLLRCALAPIATRDGVESTKVLCMAKVGDYIRLSPSKLSPSIGTSIAAELLGVRILGIVGTDGQTRTLRFVLMNKEVSASGYISNAMRVSSLMPVESSPNEDARIKDLLNAARTSAQLLHSGKLPNEQDAAKHAFFGTGICKNISVQDDSTTNTGTGTDISLELSCSGFIISMIDSTPSELAILSLHDMKLGASWNSQGTGYKKTRVIIGWVQLDNHCAGANYPVAMRPRLRAEDYHLESKDGTRHDTSRKPFTSDRPFLEAKVDIAPSHRTGIQRLTGGLSLHDVEIFLDLAFILRTQRYLFGLQGYIMDATGMGTNGFNDDSQDVWELPNIDQAQKTAKSISYQSPNALLFFQRLTILPCKVKLSVAPVRALTKYEEEFEGSEVSSIHAAVRKGDLLVGEGSAGVFGVKIGSKNLTAISVVQGMAKSILVDALLRCDGALLDFEGVALFNHTSNSPQLMTYLGAHYLTSLMNNVPSLLGSLAAFGNPLGLVRGLGDGVSDFVNEPVKGLKRSIEESDPNAFMDGVARGTGSLARHTVGGFAFSAAMLTSTAASNMAVLTLDRKYAQRRDRMLKLKANDVGLESGFQKLVSGILEGLTGVVTKPVMGAQRGGFEGFAKGLGKGLLGLLVKPSIGVTDLLTDTLHGVKGSVEGATSEGLSILNCQVRPRRALYGSDRVVKTYRIDDATASVIQSKLNTIGGENYVCHVDMVKNVALMSVTRLLILSEDGNEELLLRFDEISRVEILQPSTDVVRIHLNSDGSVNAVKEVKCEDEEIANRLRQKISEAINYTAV